MESFTVAGHHVVVKVFDTNVHSAEELTMLLHRSYKQLADMGLHFWATTQSRQETLRRIKGGKCYVALNEDKMIGTICFYESTEKEDSKWYHSADVARFGQFAVDPTYQKIGLGKMLLEIVEDVAIAKGKKHLAMDTSEKATHLIDYYHRLGFAHVEYIQWERVNYRSTVMSKKLKT